MYIGQNIKYLRTKREMSQEDLANALGYKSYTTITKWESGVSEPTLKKTNQIADFFKVSVNELCYTRMCEVKESSNKKKGVQIKVLGKVAAGVPLEAIEDIIDYEEITEELARTGEFFALKINGDSMEPKFSRGDVVIVRKQEDAESGDIVIVGINGNDATCKRLKKFDDSIMLISTNTAYEPMIYNKEQIKEKPVKIIGRVVELRAKF